MTHDPTVRATYEATKEPTGFPNRTDSAISFVNGTLTFSIAPTGSEFEFYTKGVRRVVGASDDIVITDTEGLWFFYYDLDGVLQATQTFVPQIITEFAYVAVLYWDAVNNAAIYFGEERHGLTMDGQTHSYLHNSVGAAYINGLLLGSFVPDAAGDTDSHAQFDVDNGEIRDEDIVITIDDGVPQDLTPIAQIPVFYRDGANANWRRKTADNFPIIHSGTAGYTGASGRVAWNQFTGGAWQLTEVGENNFVLVHYFATNDINHPVIGVQGVAEYTSIADARAGAGTEINELGGLPFAEFVPIGSVIFETASTYTNTPQARVRTTDNGANYLSFLPGNIYLNSHSNLTGLTAQDHPASAVFTDTAAFGRMLSGAESDVQLALDKIDDDGALITKEVEAATADPAPTAAESDKVFTNEGATAQVTMTLPLAAPGLQFTFVVQDADGIAITASGTDTIRDAGSVSSAGGTLTSTNVGDSVTLTAINAAPAGEWMVTAKNETGGAGSWATA